MGEEKRISPGGTPMVSFKALARLVKGNHVNKQVLVQFYSQLSTLISAGFSIVKALRVCRQQSSDEALDRILSSVEADLEGGSTLTAAFEKFPTLFTPFHIGMIRTAEMSGTLPDILKSLALYEEKEMKLIQSIKAALSYPIFVTITAFFIVILLTRYLTPLLDSISSILGSEKIPLITKGLIFVGRCTTDIRYILGVIIIFLVIVYAIGTLRTIRKVQYFWGRLKLRIPSFGKLYKKVILIRMCRVLSTLLAAGVPSVLALRLVDEVAENVYFSEAIMKKIIWGVDEGKNFSQAFGESQFFPKVLVNMLVVGEQTGKLPLTIDKLADLIEIDVTLFLANIASILEPVLIVILGGVTFTILLAAFMPIYAIMSSF
ncbi:MAG: type II secretion system F family protein [Candidatus Eremiobacteraeota bacterium]|nr:type II secretion system F family protein [Candidatus Eremiobacteraeota bacterium]